MIKILEIAQIKRETDGSQKNKLSIVERLLMILEYWKADSTYRIIAKKYGISDVNCIRNIFWVI